MPLMIVPFRRSVRGQRLWRYEAIFFDNDLHALLGHPAGEVRGTITTLFGEIGIDFERVEKRRRWPNIKILYEAPCLSGLASASEGNIVRILEVTHQDPQTLDPFISEHVGNLDVNPLSLLNQQLFTDFIAEFFHLPIIPA